MDPPSSSAAPHVPSVPSDLSKLCLPQEYNDANRRLAWANSICCLFLLIGLVGLKPPRVHVRPLPEVMEIVPIVIVPADDTPPPMPAAQPPERDQTTEATPDPPVVAAVVAADASKIAFAIPVASPMVLAPAHLASPPPPRTVRPPAGEPTRYVPSVGDWGGHPMPAYPGMAQRMGYHGTTTMLITLDPSGAVKDVQLKKSSGYRILDDTALDHVRKHLRLLNPPGEVRFHTLDWVWKLKS